MIEAFADDQPISLPKFDPSSAQYSNYATIVPSVAPGPVAAPVSKPVTTASAQPSAWSSFSKDLLSFATDAYKSFNDAQRLKFERDLATIKNQDAAYRAATGYQPQYTPPPSPIDWKMILLGLAGAAAVATVVVVVAKKRKR